MNETNLAILFLIVVSVLYEILPAKSIENKICLIVSLGQIVQFDVCWAYFVILILCVLDAVYLDLPVRKKL